MHIGIEARRLSVVVLPPKCCVGHIRFGLGGSWAEKRFPTTVHVDGYFRIGPRGAEGTAAHLLVRRPTLEIEPVDQVDARTLVVGDVVRLSGPQGASRRADDDADRRVVLELRPLGLAKRQPLFAVKLSSHLGQSQRLSFRETPTKPVQSGFAI
jgi:hypothetical protein